MCRDLGFVRNRAAVHRQPAQLGMFHTPVRGTTCMRVSVKRSHNDVAHDRATPDWMTPQLIERTRVVWQKFYSHPLTREEAVDILRRVGRLIDVLRNPPEPRIEENDCREPPARARAEIDG